ncbi:MAG: photosystem II stability/assembly factor-like uncharacterized protein, partial [Saprospiraceae bacterium]
TSSVGAIAVANSNSNILYCGMGEHAPRGVMTSHGDGVYKSIDAGKTWMHIGLAPTQHIARIIIHPTNPDIVFVAAQGALYGPTKERGIYKSVDGGKTWKNVLFVNELTGCSELTLDPNLPHIMYATMWEHQRKPWKVISGGDGSGVYKSTDAGESWFKIEKGLPDELGKMAITICPSNTNKLYALIESDTEKDLGGLFVSINAGDSWTRVSDDNRLTQRAWYYIEVFADPQDENTVYVLSAPALRSLDGGKTWERISGTHGDYHDLWINPDNPKNLCIANDGGAAISFNFGKSWSGQDNMPTGQYYRVNVDNNFPYRIYAGQQDYGSVRIEHRALGERGIDYKNWTSSAGGESAFLAFDPEDPRYVLGGSYQGTIEILDTKAKAGTKIMAAPHEYLGEDAKDIKYRFNWNAPIIWSQHEVNTYYHGAHMLLKTKDMGVSWVEASPDLTNNEVEKQGKGGGPYTNEAVGAENYGTLSYVVESPHEMGVIYTGSDDGVVQVTRDNCKTWTRITPKGLAECLINAIEVSPHDPATAYIATTRYKFNDHTPGLYKTTNYGKTWKNISSNLPKGAFTRVVREDPGQKGFLIAGTELGIYASWDDGKEWQALQLNLPLCPITDLILKFDDIVAATSGRAFWILDDLPTLRQFGTADSALKILTPEDAYFVNGSSELNSSKSSIKGSNAFRGVNPANGVVIYYELSEIKDDEHITIEITNSAGKLVNQFSSLKDSTFVKYDGGPSVEPILSKSKGLNRFVWNMKYRSMNGISKAYIEANYAGHKTIPGSYKITLRAGEKESTTNANIIPNPLYPNDVNTLKEYDQFMTSMEEEVIAMHNLVNHNYELQMKLSSVLSTLKNNDKNKELMTTGQGLLSKLKAWDEKMIQRKSKAYDDVENFRNKFTANYLFMINQTQSDIPRVNNSSQERRAELDAIWKILKAEGEEIKSIAIPLFNKALWNAGIGAVWAE